MVKIWKNHSMKVIAVLMMVAILIGTVFSVNILSTKADDDKENQWDWYYVASAAAGSMNKMLAPSGGTAGSFQYTGINAGNAASLMGYTDKDMLGENKGGFFLTSMVTTATISYDYTSFITSVSGSTSQTAAPTSLYAYARYGYALSKLGIDSTGTDGSALGRKIIAGPMYLAYSLAEGAPTVMNIFMKFLQTINPFHFVSKSAHIDTSEYNVGTGASGGFAGALDGAALWYSKIYDAMYDWAWIMIPIFLVLLIFSLFLGSRRTGGSGGTPWGKVKKYIIRVAFVVIGVPLLGTMYTSTLDYFIDQTDDNNSAATLVVASTFVDFKSWAEESNLAIDDNMTIGIVRQQGVYEPTASAIWFLRPTTVAINNKGRFNLTIPDSWNTYSGSTMDKLAKWSVSISEGSASKATEDNRRAAYSLMNDYFSGQKYTSADYSSKVTSEWVGSVNFPGTGLEMDKTTKLLVKWDKWYDDKIGEAGDLFVGSEKFFINNGTLTSSVSETATDEPYIMSWSSGNKGLSDLGMFNYLETAFTSSGINVYSSHDSISLFTRQSHFNANLIGTGMLAFGFYINSLITLISYAVLGWFFAFAILFSNLKRGITLLFKIPFAMLGAMRSIAQVITYTAIMLLEIIGTLFVYVLVLEFMKAIPQAIQTALAGAGLGATVGMNVYLWASTLFMLFFTIYAFRIRKNIVKGLDEAAASLVDKFTSTQGSMPNEKSALGNLAKGAAVGAGAAVGSKMMNKADNKDVKDTSKAEGVERDKDAQSNGDNPALPGPSGSDGSDGGGGEGGDGANGSDGQGMDTAGFGQDGASASDKELGEKTENQNSLAEGDSTNTVNEGDSAAEDGGEVKELSSADNINEGDSSMEAAEASSEASDYNQASEDYDNAESHYREAEAQLSEAGDTEGASEAGAKADEARSKSIASHDTAGKEANKTANRDLKAADNSTSAEDAEKHLANAEQNYAQAASHAKTAAEKSVQAGDKQGARKYNERAKKATQKANAVGGKASAMAAKNASANGDHEAASQHYQDAARKFEEAAKGAKTGEARASYEKNAQTAKKLALKESRAQGRADVRNARNEARGLRQTSSNESHSATGSNASRSATSSNESRSANTGGARTNNAPTGQSNNQTARPDSRRQSDNKPSGMSVAQGAALGAIGNMARNSGSQGAVSMAVQGFAGAGLVQGAQKNREYAQNGASGSTYRTSKSNDAVKQAGRQARQQANSNTAALRKQMRSSKATDTAGMKVDRAAEALEQKAQALEAKAQAIEARTKSILNQKRSAARRKSLDKNFPDENL